jgi:hypothetical protein
MQPRFRSLVGLGVAAVVAIPILASTMAGNLTFSNIRPKGEPGISIAANGTMAMVGLRWLFEPAFFGTHVWTGPFGSTPTFQGLIDAALQQPPCSEVGMPMWTSDPRFDFTRPRSFFC